MTKWRQEGPNPLSTEGIEEEIKDHVTGFIDALQRSRQPRYADLIDALLHVKAVLIQSENDLPRRD